MDVSTKLKSDWRVWRWKKWNNIQYSKNFIFLIKIIFWFDHKKLSRICIDMVIPLVLSALISALTSPFLSVSFCSYNFWCERFKVKLCTCWTIHHWKAILLWSLEQYLSNGNKLFSNKQILENTSNKKVGGEYSIRKSTHSKMYKVS